MCGSASSSPTQSPIARGSSLELNPEEVVIRLDRVLDAVDLMQRVQQTRSAGDEDDNSEIMSHIDKEGLFGRMARVRSNLA
jgi:hypothetical protein